jgi:GxxExxY protein
MYADEMNEERDPQTYAIIGAAMAVHSELGHGFLEAVYQEALQFEFNNRDIPHSRETAIPIYYSGTKLKTNYVADFMCYQSIIVELKAVSTFDNAHFAQTINYLKATGFTKGLLINFGSSRLQYKRFIRTK